MKRCDLSMKKFLNLLAVILTFFAVQQFCRSQTEGFSLSKINSDYPASAKWEISCSQEKLMQVQQILNQPYYYLGSGVQCYAFESEDKQYVLKLFKHYHMWPDNALLRHMPVPSLLKNWCQKVIQQREERLEHLFESAKIAYEDLGQQTGVLFVHLNPSRHQFPLLSIHDKLHIQHLIALDQIPFVLQKKAGLLFPKIKQYLDEHNQQKALAIINQLLDIIDLRSQKGIRNSDPILRRNVGLINDRPIEIDIGSFAYDPYIHLEKQRHRELFFETLELKDWLKQIAPQLVSHVEEQIQLRNQF